MNKLSSFLLCMALTLCAAGASAQVPAGPAAVNLRSAANFAVLGSTTVTNTGKSVILGDLGVWAGSAYVPGTPSALVVGTIHAADHIAQLAQGDLTIAYNDAAGRTLGPVSVAGNLGGQTLAPGLYKSTSSLEISSGDLTLAGDETSVFIFQMASTLVTTTNRKVILLGGVMPANIFWQVGSSATLGTRSVFQGTIMAYTSISIATGATLNGRALAQHGAVTLDTDVVLKPSVSRSGR